MISVPRSLLFFLPSLSALLLFLAFPPAGLFPLVFVCLVPWLVYLRGAGAFKAAAASYIAGFITIATTCYWLGVVTLAGLFAAAFIGGFYYAAFGALVATFKGRPLWRALFAAALFAGLEFLRSRLFWLAFPWALLPHTLYRVPHFLQSASIVGTFGTSFLIAAVNSFLAETIMGEERKPSAVALCVAFLLLVFPAVWMPKEAPSKGGFKVLVVQGNIPQSVKELALEEARGLLEVVADKSVKVMDDHIRLTEEALRQDRPNLIVWPETMVPGALLLQPNRYARLCLCVRRWGAPLLLGSEHRHRCLPYNSALLLDPHNCLVRKRYDKMVLVPVGEYIPAQSLLPFFVYLVLQMMPYEPEDIQAGDKMTLFEVDGRRIYVPICFELSFDDLVREALDKGADLVVNISNDAWFEDSAELDLAVAQGVLRAIEFRVPVIRCVNAGISCYISPSGRFKLLADKEGCTKQIEGVMWVEPEKMGGTTLARFLAEPAGWVLLIAPLVAWVLSFMRRCRKDTSKQR